MATDTTTRYVIESVRDFQAVPEDRIDDCLHEFGTYLRMVRPAADLLTHISDEVNGADAILFKAGNRFEWVDDGRRDFTLRVTLPDGSEAAAFTITPESAETMLANLEASEAATPSNDTERPFGAEKHGETPISGVPQDDSQ